MFVKPFKLGLIPVQQVSIESEYGVQIGTDDVINALMLSVSVNILILFIPEFPRADCNMVVIIHGTGQLFFPMI